MKLKTTEFKVGQEVWHIRYGFVVLKECPKGVHPFVFVIDGDSSYTRDGKIYTSDTHRSIFTLEEAKELFGVEKEKKKKTVVMYQVLVRDDGGKFFATERVWENAEDAKKGWGNRFIKLLTDRPIEFEIDEV